MKILFIGDIVGKAGRRIVVEKIDSIIEKNNIELVIANCENCAAGFGVTPTLADGLFNIGVEVLTSGNHIWDKKEILPYLDSKAEILRPANYPTGTPGRGVYTGATTAGTSYVVMNLQGRVHMPLTDCPFRKADQLIDQIPPDTLVRFVDFHAEATSEKIALGWYLDGRVSAVVGTHTHIQTADERVLPGGTAYVTDAGMTGPYESVIGMNREASINRFLQATPTRFEPATGDARISGVILSLDPTTGKARSIERLSILRD
jgi:metallophosphoesterase (TIGR00282 family)